MKKFLIIVAALVVFGVAQPVHAETTAYLIKDDSNTVFQFNAEELETSYINNRFGHGDDSLYQSFKEKLSANGFYAFLTDNNKYVDYKDLESTYISNTSNFNLNEFLASDQSDEVDVLPSDITLVSNIDDSIAEPKESEEVMSDEEKSIHDYSKEEMEEWIDKEADLERLRSHPIIYDFYNDDIVNANEYIISSKGPYVNDLYLQPTTTYMENYFTRNYNTIGEQYIKSIRRHYCCARDYNGTYYDDFSALFGQIVQDTKDEKRISESVFISGKSMVHQSQDNKWGSAELRVRGTQYIRYISGTALPDGVKLDRWYKRDVDVQIGSFGYSRSSIDWDPYHYTIDEIFPITSYEEIHK